MKNFYGNSVGGKGLFKKLLDYSKLLFFYLFFVVVEGSALLQCLTACMESSLISSKCCSN